MRQRGAMTSSAMTTVPSAKNAKCRKHEYKRKKRIGKVLKKRIENKK